MPLNDSNQYDLCGDLRSLLADIERNIQDLTLMEARLTEAGCENGSLHFKTGTNKMYHLTPSTEGRRKFTYIGVREEAQEEARDRLARYEVREAVRRHLAIARADRATAVRNLDRIRLELVNCKMVGRKVLDTGRESLAKARPAKRKKSA